MRGHDVCTDVHTALSIAQTVLASRDRRVAASSQVESSESLLRELRALGVVDAAPQLVAMVAIVDAAVGRLADAGAMTEDDAWGELRKEVLRQHCQAPDVPYE